MTDTFSESGMTFGPFENEKFFHLEKSKLFRHCNGLKTVEFIYHRKKYILWFVEAKSSSPMDYSGNEENYERSMKEIIQKFEDSLYLFLAGLMERKAGHEEISEGLKKADYAKMNFIFLLILNGYQDVWLPPLKQDLEQKMKSFRTIWNSEVIVMNDTMAREERLIQ